MCVFGEGEDIGLYVGSFGTAATASVLSQRGQISLSTRLSSSISGASRIPNQAEQTDYDNGFRLCSSRLLLINTCVPNRRVCM